VTNRFGRHLYKTFFETYTAKVWGIQPHLIGAQWAAQRIKGLSLRSALQHMLSNPRRRAGQDTARTLIDEFHYPRLGPGMMWERLAARVEQAGGAIRTNSAVVALHHAGGRLESVEIDTHGRRDVLPAGHVISTMAIRDLIGALRPPPPPAVTAAAGSLNYRDFLTVALILDVADLFPDNWIYVHDSAVKVGRIQNFKNWSPDMVPDASRTCLGLEYFCAEGDGLWSMADADLVALATRELAAIGLANPTHIVDGTVVRVRKAYPVYDNGYMEALRVVRTYVDGFANLQLVGRNGMHKYNNQDHSMLTAMLAVRNLDGERHDLWAMNTGDEYHEEESSANEASTDLGADGRRIATTQPRVPRPLSVRRDEP
jgi:protoporphyrinogen oxidase